MWSRRAALLVLIPLAFAGCGGDSDDSGTATDGGSDGATTTSDLASKSPQQILEDTAAALADVKTYRVEGKEGAGKKATSVSGDIGLPSQLRIELGRGGATATMTVTKGSLYIKANAAFWSEEQGDRAAGPLDQGARFEPRAARSHQRARPGHLEPLSIEGARHARAWRQGDGRRPARGRDRRQG